MVALGDECTPVTLRHLPKFNVGWPFGPVVYIRYAPLHLCGHLTMVLMLAETSGNLMDVDAGCASNGDLVVISSSHSPALLPSTDMNDFDFEASYIP